MQTVIQKTVGFFKKIFSRNEPIQTKIVTKKLKALTEELEAKFSEKEKELLTINAKKMAEIKHSYSKSLELLKTIQGKEIQEKENEKFNRAAGTSKKQLEQQLSQVLQKINPEGKTNNLIEAKDYSRESLHILVTNINSFKKNITYTSFYLKEEMSQLGEKLQEMITGLQEMNNLFEKENLLFEFEEFKKNSAKFVREKAVIEEKLREKGLRLKEIEELEKKRDEQLNVLEKSMQSEEAKKLETLQKEKTTLLDEKQQLRTEVSVLISSVDRPLQRFKSLAKSGRWILSKDRIELIDSYMGNPLIALRADPKGEMLKEIIKEVIASIEQGKVELKDDEKKKKLNSLKQLAEFDFFGKIFWRMNEVQKKQTELDKSISENHANALIEMENEKLKEIENKINEIKQEITIQERIKENSLKELNEYKEFLEKFGEKVFKEKIILDD